MAAWRVLLDGNVDPKVAAHLEDEEVVAEHFRDALTEGADDETDVLSYAPRTRAGRRHERRDGFR